MNAQTRNALLAQMAPNSLVTQSNAFASLGIQPRFSGPPNGFVTQTSPNGFVTQTSPNGFVTQTSPNGFVTQSALPAAVPQQLCFNTQSQTVCFSVQDITASDQLTTQLSLSDIARYGQQAVRAATAAAPTVIQALDAAKKAGLFSTQISA